MASAFTAHLYVGIRIPHVQHTFLLEIPDYSNKERASMMKSSP